MKLCKNLYRVRTLPFHLKEPSLFSVHCDLIATVLQTWRILKKLMGIICGWLSVWYVSKSFVLIEFKLIEISCVKLMHSSDVQKLSRRWIRSNTECSSTCRSCEWFSRRSVLDVSFWFSILSAQHWLLRGVSCDGQIEGYFLMWIHWVQSHRNRSVVQYISDMIIRDLKISWVDVD